MRDRPALAQQASLGLIRAHIGRPILYLPRRGSDFRPRRVFGMCRCAVILLRPHNPAKSGRPRELALLNFCLSALGAQFKCWMCPRVCCFMLLSPRYLPILRELLADGGADALWLCRNRPDPTRNRPKCQDSLSGAWFLSSSRLFDYVTIRLP